VLVLLLVVIIVVRSGVGHDDGLWVVRYCGCVGQDVLAVWVLLLLFMVVAVLIV